MEASDGVAVGRLEGNVHAVAGRRRAAVNGRLEAEDNVGGAVVNRGRGCLEAEADQLHQRAIERLGAGYVVCAH